MPESENQSPQTAAVYPESGRAELRELIEAGVFYGRKKSKRNPKMSAYVILNRGGTDVINLQKVLERLAEAEACVKEVARRGGLLLVVGTEAAAEGGVLRLAQKFNLPFVVHRWVGGTLTNFKVIAARVAYLKKMKSDLAAGAFEKYTKKERLEIEREIRRLEELMGGLGNLAREPDAVLVVNPVVHATAMREARRRRIPIVAFASTDADPDDIDYLVPGNDKSKMSIEWFLGKIGKAIEAGMAEREKIPEEGKEKDGKEETKTGQHGF